MFALGETTYRAALANFRSSSSDIFLSRVRNASTSKLAKLNRWLWVAKTSTATKNETVLGREGLNTILASTQREDFGGQEPVWAYSTHTY